VPVVEARTPSGRPPALIFHARAAPKEVSRPIIVPARNGVHAPPVEVVVVRPLAKFRRSEYRVSTGVEGEPSAAAPRAFVQTIHRQHTSSVVRPRLRGARDEEMAHDEEIARVGPRVDPRDRPDRDRVSGSKLERKENPPVPDDGWRIRTVRGLNQPHTWNQRWRPPLADRQRLGQAVKQRQAGSDGAWPRPA